MSAKYWIAKYTPDLFRNEPRNIGVLVERNGKTFAKFIGEKEPGKIDGRKIQDFKNPDVFKQWVDYWRNELDENKDINELVSTDEVKHFKILDAGKLTHYNGDTVQEITEYLYSLLISDEGFKGALKTIESEEDTIKFVRLTNEIKDQFSSLNILSKEQDLLIKHPIIQGKKIEGKKSTHKLTFAQENGALDLIEPVDFSTSDKKRSLDHAGFTAYMFRDIRDRDSEANAYSIVKYEDSDLEEEHVDYGLKVLKNESDLINWDNKQEREKFLEKRREIAEPVF